VKNGVQVYQQTYQLLHIYQLIISLNFEAGTSTGKHIFRKDHHFYIFNDFLEKSTPKIKIVLVSQSQISVQGMAIHNIGH
jgi:hypothetical protein